MCARMQAAHKLGAGAAARAGPGCDLFAGAGARLLWAKSAAERYIEKKATPIGEGFFITTFLCRFHFGLGPVTAR
jgi:hypothetical protein